MLEKTLGEQEAGILEFLARLAICARELNIGGGRDAMIPKDRIMPAFDV